MLQYYWLKWAPEQYQSDTRTEENNEHYIEFPSIRETWDSPSHSSLSQFPNDPSLSPYYFYPLAIDLTAYSSYNCLPVTVSNCY